MKTYLRSTTLILGFSLGLSSWGLAAPTGSITPPSSPSGGAQGGEGKAEIQKFEASMKAKREALMKQVQDFRAQMHTQMEQLRQQAEQARNSQSGSNGQSHPFKAKFEQLQQQREAFHAKIQAQFEELRKERQQFMEQLKAKHHSHRGGGPGGGSTTPSGTSPQSPTSPSSNALPPARL